MTMTYVPWFRGVMWHVSLINTCRNSEACKLVGYLLSLESAPENLRMHSVIVLISLLGAWGMVSGDELYS